VTGKAYELHGVRVLECAAEGDCDAIALLCSAFEHRTELMVIPAERFKDEFFDLKTRIAGEFLQKFVTYRVRVAILGDISRHVGASKALRDFVYECNRGDSVWFVSDVAELNTRAAALGSRQA
jgi:hypothetical protein